MRESLDKWLAKQNPKTVEWKEPCKKLTDDVGIQAVCIKLADDYESGKTDELTFLSGLSNLTGKSLEQIEEILKKADVPDEKPDAIIPYSRTLKIVNTEQLPKGTGARYLIAIHGPDDVLIAKKWARVQPKTLASGEVLIDMTPKKNDLSIEHSSEDIPKPPTYTKEQLLRWGKANTAVIYEKAYIAALGELRKTHHWPEYSARAINKILQDAGWKVPEPEENDEDDDTEDDEEVSPMGDVLEEKPVKKEVDAK